MGNELGGGQRVVRGPDWKWGDQDCGEGYVGTVVAKKPLEDEVIVRWDMGTAANYRCAGPYDLRILDNTAAGVVHPPVQCDGCGEHGLKGIRWKCHLCDDYDLCSACYHGDKHDLSHAFLRIDVKPERGVEKVPARFGSKKVQAKGIFPGAKVIRGTDWKWDNQDGGSGNVGTVKRLEEGLVRVQWSSGSTNVYRMGQEMGKVDLQCKVAADGISYYRDHLGYYGQSNAQPTAGSGDVGDLFTQMLLQAMEEAKGVAGKVQKVADSVYAVGDKVRMKPELIDTVGRRQSGWNPRMEACLKEIGTVMSIDVDDDVLKIQVHFVEFGETYGFPENLLMKVCRFTKGNDVKIIKSLPLAKSLQQGHGGWNDGMRAALGQVGKVLQVDKDGDVEVMVAGNKWYFNACCCEMVSTPEPPEPKLAPVEVDEASSLPSPNKASSDGGSVFISFAEKDKGIVEKIKIKFRADDIKMCSGTTLGEKVKGIQGASAIVVCMSQAFENSDSCKQESEFADQLKKPVIPLLVEASYEPHNWVESLLGAKIYIEVHDDRLFDRSYTQLKRQLKLQGVSSSSTPSTPVQGSSRSASKGPGLQMSKEEWKQIFMSFEAKKY